MGSRIVNFIKYNNAFTLAFVFLLLSTGTIFAANEDLRGTLIETEEFLVAVDNSYIRTVDLDTFDPAIQIIEITEDDMRFYVTYRFNTIQVFDGVWAEVSNQEVLTVDKATLGERDLGLYIAEELQEVADSQMAHLREVQAIEQEIGMVPRVIKTEYEGLIGRMFDASEATFVGYKPVIPEKKAPVKRQPNSNLAGSDKKTTSPEPERDSDSNEGVDTTAPTITLVGSATIELSLNSDFTDPGATAEDDVDGDLTDSIATTGFVDVASGGTYEITYEVTDSSGNTATLSRFVSVQEAAPQVDDVPPVITLIGSQNVSIIVNETYSEQGATAEDNIDGVLTDDIVTNSDVDESTAGTYRVTYTVTDTAGNSSSKIRNVTVTAAPSQTDSQSQELQPEAQDILE